MQANGMARVAFAKCMSRVLTVRLGMDKGGNNRMRTIDVVHAPWCFIEAPEEDYKRKLADQYGVEVREFNLWEIDDEDLATMPEHVARAIRKAREDAVPEEDWHSGGSIFFLDGEPLHLSPALKWPQVETVLRKGKEVRDG